MPTRDPRLTTARLHLRRLVANDADWIWQLDQDPEVMRHINGGLPTPRSVLEQQYLPRFLMDYPAGPHVGFWAAESRATGEPLGWFHLRPEKLPPHEMELGYRLRREVWGQGLATEGSRELLRRAFADWGLARVAAHTLAVNLASRRVMEKCGLRWERDFLVPQEWLPGWNEEQRRAVRYILEAPRS